MPSRKALEEREDTLCGFFPKKTVCGLIRIPIDLKCVFSL